MCLCSTCLVLIISTWCCIELYVYVALGLYERLAQPCNFTFMLPLGCMNDGRDEPRRDKVSDIDIEMICGHFGSEIRT